MPTREPTLPELEAALRIDEHSLESECRDQAVMYYNVARMGTLATSHRDEAKKNLAEIEAELDAYLRRSAETSGERITEAAIKSGIKLDKKYQRAATELAKLSTEVGNLSALERSYDHRKEMLKLMVKLYLANYFGEIEERGVSTEFKNGAARHAQRVLSERYAEKEENNKKGVQRGRSK